MKPEEKARKQIDLLLEQAGWKVQEYRELNLGASLGVAVRESPLKSGSAGYLLFAGRKPVGVVGAKPQGATLNRVVEENVKFITRIEESLPQISTAPPFSYETARWTGKVYQLFGQQLNGILEELNERLAA